MADTVYGSPVVPYVEDADGTRAVPHLPYVKNASGLYVPWPVDASGNPSVSLPESLPAGSATLGAVNEQRWNGSAWEAVQNNTQGTLLASAARTGAGVSAMQTNSNARGVAFIVNVSAVSGTSPVLSFAVQFVDPVTGDASYLGNATNITATDTYNYVVYPANNVADLGGQNVGLLGTPLPRQWQLSYNMGGTTPSFTFSVGYALIN